MSLQNPTSSPPGTPLANSVPVAPQGSGRVATPLGRLGLRIAAITFLFWTIGLVLLGWETANPQLVSAPQLRQSSAIVVGRAVEGSRDKVRIERVLQGALAPEEEIIVLNLRDTAAARQPELAYVLPLSRFRGDFVVTVLDTQRDPPLIYPATPQTIEQVKGIVRGPVEP